MASSWMARIETEDLRGWFFGIGSTFLILCIGVGKHEPALGQTADAPSRDHAAETEAPALNSVITAMSGRSGWWIGEHWSIRATSIRRRPLEVVLYDATGRCHVGGTWWVSADRLVMTLDPAQAGRTTGLRASGDVRIAGPNGAYGTGPRAYSLNPTAGASLASTDERPASWVGTDWRLWAERVAFAFRPDGTVRLETIEAPPR